MCELQLSRKASSQTTSTKLILQGVCVCVLLCAHVCFCMFMLASLQFSEMLYHLTLF